MKSEFPLEEAEFASVFKIITTHRSRTLVSINEEMILTNWEIGAFISTRINAGRWNSAIIERLANYIKRNDPTLHGYSKSNLYAVATFYEKYSSTEFYSFVKQIMLRSGKFGKLFPATGWKKLPEIAEVKDVKHENENPSIGILLCRDANQVVVEYAMSRTMSPVMVAQYKRMLIPKEVLQRTFEDYLNM